MSSWVSALGHESDRYRTFAGWKTLESDLVTPEGLSAAGFYFNPTGSSPDRCTCFICGISLVQWEVSDDPLLEHSKHSPKCAFVKATYPKRPAPATPILQHRATPPCSPTQPQPAGTGLFPTDSHFVRDVLFSPFTLPASWSCADIDS
eukprot:TRINITY_DN11405_c0_g1_i1.p1 TRINITY_DN11405_c0_g1~~TRINITY_DN11405_c0_g1_i1.p1  ORF type:complete len:148 (+),score=11.19 TRINITY_DN11405_c0_g1_i1:52-495(+)